ncbi:hypothetical protein [Rhodococcus pyridinivorans]
MGDHIEDIIATASPPQVLEFVVGVVPVDVQAVLSLGARPHERLEDKLMDFAGALFPALMQGDDEVP